MLRTQYMPACHKPGASSALSVLESAKLYADTMGSQGSSPSRSISSWLSCEPGADKLTNGCVGSYSSTATHTDHYVIVNRVEIEGAHLIPNWYCITAQITQQQLYADHFFLKPQFSTVSQTNQKEHIFRSCLIYILLQ